MDFMNGLKEKTNYKYTENGAVAHDSTLNANLDMFAMGGAMLGRDDSDILLMFMKAYQENPETAVRCLFYLRDILGGQGQRRFFRVCLKWLAQNSPQLVKDNFENIPHFGRWDDMYAMVGTTLEKDMFTFLKKQLALDTTSKTPSLLAKWLKSENTSSKESCELGRKTRIAFGMTPKQYRKTLSVMRDRINVLERLMSTNRWDEIEFDKIPSKAGLIYKNAFARRDIIKEKYEKFAKSKETKVNAAALAPYEVVEKVFGLRYGDDVDRAIVNKYWDNLTDYFKGKTFNGIAVVDTSGSMTIPVFGTNIRPIDVAISLGMYCAEKNSGPYKGNYISFASRPQLIPVYGVDFVDKVERIYRTNLVDNTNIEAAFDLLLDVAKTNRLKQEEIPQNVIVISDMEFDRAVTTNTSSYSTFFENMQQKWSMCGYKMPNLIFWNVSARQNNIPAIGDGISYVSGFSPSIFETIISGKTGHDLMKEKLYSERYNCLKFSGQKFVKVSE